MTEQDVISTLKYQKESGFLAIRFLDAIDMAVKALEEIQQYREIGTVKDCKEAKEKQNAKKPIETKDCSNCKEECNDKCTSFSYGPTWLCPHCKENFIWNSEYDIYHKHCTNCGQAIDWSDTE